MATSRWKITLLILFILIAITVQCSRYYFDIHAQSQARLGANSGAMELSAPALDGKADGKVLPFKRTGENLKAALFAHPAPEVWLVFRAPAKQGQPQDAPNDMDEPIARIELTSEAKRALRSHWDAALNYYYKSEFGEVPDTESDRDESVTLTNSFLSTTRKLKSLLIDAPDGRRKISRNEAGDLARFVAAAAAKLVEDAKKQGND